MKTCENDTKFVEIGPVLAEICAYSVSGDPLYSRAPAGAYRGRKIRTPTFFDNLTPNQPKSAKKINFGKQILREYTTDHTICESPITSWL